MFDHLTLFTARRESCESLKKTRRKIFPIYAVRFHANVAASKVRGSKIVGVGGPEPTYLLNANMKSFYSIATHHQGGWEVRFGVSHCGEEEKKIATKTPGRITKVIYENKHLNNIICIFIRNSPLHE